MSCYQRKCARHLTTIISVLMSLLACGFAHVAPVIVLDNLSTSAGFPHNGTSIHSTSWKAVGFTAAGPDLNLTRFDARLDDYGAVASVEAVLFDDAGGVPGSEIASFVSATLGPNESESFLFNLSSPVLLVDGESYWIAVRGSDNVSLLWDRNPAFSAPTGTCPFNGYLLSGDGGSSWSGSTAFNAFTLYAEPP